ncbi:MAG: hypothetical protein KBE97_07260 [Leptotrichiaceae bacterium]|jgi:hypothetical protein|nr:hypothetical protein [Leptotrichiaceae bacterium]
MRKKIKIEMSHFQNKNRYYGNIPGKKIDFWIVTEDENQEYDFARSLCCFASEQYLLKKRFTIENMDAIIKQSFVSLIEEKVDKRVKLDEKVSLLIIMIYRSEAIIGNIGYSRFSLIRNKEKILEISRNRTEKIILKDGDLVLLDSEISAEENGPKMSSRNSIFKSIRVYSKMLLILFCFISVGKTIEGNKKYITQKPTSKIETKMIRTWGNYKISIPEIQENSSIEIIDKKVSMNSKVKQNKRKYKNKNNQISLDEEIKQNWKALGKDEEGNDL